MVYYQSILLISVISLFVIPFIPSKNKSYFAFFITIINIILSSIPAIQSILGTDTNFIISTAFPFNDIPVRVDSLSAWFMLIINFTMLTGSWYGIYYMEQYKKETNNLSLHYDSLIILHVSMLLVCSIQNSLLFLIVWELMAVSSFILVIFENGKENTIKAGINYLIQSHISVAVLTIAFIWVMASTGSNDFNAVNLFVSKNLKFYNNILFLLFLAGFGIKAGFVPFHTWLPIAHPSAPSHVSGIMSGVMIKLGIYGILRMILYIQYDYLFMGLVLLFLSIISGLYGVIMAVIQHNLKKLLAYHSIENIGIIGIGIGIGLIGLGLNNNFLAFLGFSGGMLHVFNHSLFKSLLFYGAGSIYHQTHKINVEQLGGLIKKMPHTAFLFLIGSLAICGLPPFNGFISEFLLYVGLFSALPMYDFNFSIIILAGIISLVLIGGIAILCFSKACGIVFLGVEREPYHDEVKEVKHGMLIPQYLTLAMMIGIGLFPGFFMTMLLRPVKLFVPVMQVNQLPWVTDMSNLLSLIGLLGIGFLIFVLAIYWLRKIVTKGRAITTSPTWGCGYAAPGSRMQYTATSYVKTFTSLAKPFLGIRKQETAIEKIFPLETEFKISSYDKIEENLIKSNLSILNNFLDKFTFLQSGKIQFYILYGLIFIVLIMLISFFQSVKLF